MGVKAEYNPSTGKMHFTAATGKVQVVGAAGPPGICDDCDNPATIQVVISGLTDCCGKGTGSSVGITPSIVDLFNGTHTLTRIVKCLYTKPIDVSSGTYKYLYYNDTEACDTTPNAEETIIAAGIGVNLLTEPGVYRCDLTLTGAGTGQILAQRWTAPLELPCYDQTIDPSIYPVCETGPGEGFLSTYTNILAGGTWTMSETP